MKQAVTAPKTDMFRIRINPDMRKQLEAICEQNGLTLTDAVNVFFQQSLRAGGFPFPAATENAEQLRQKAVEKLIRELQHGSSCASSCKETLAVLEIDP